MEAFIRIQCQQQALPPPVAHGPAYRLYCQAQRGSWQIDQDLQWQPVSRQQFPFPPQDCVFSGFADYEALPQQVRCDLAWQQHATEISEILYGEEAAMQMCAGILRGLRENSWRQSICAQLHDEARHVEFFSRYLIHADLPLQSPGLRLQQLLHAGCAEMRTDHQLLICQLIIESLAMARFQRLRRRTRVAVLRQALPLISRDEARHINFGLMVLGDRLQRRSRAQREHYGLLVVETVCDLLADSLLPQGLGQQLGWDGARLRRHLRQQRRVHGDYQKRVFRYLLRNMRQLGLLAPVVMQRLHQRGVLQ